MSLLNDDVKLLNMTTNMACIAGGFVVCFPFVVMVRKVRRSRVKDKQRSNEKTMGEGSSGKRQRECLPSPSLKVCTDGQLTYSDIITKFPWIDRCSFPIGMFIYHSIPLLYQCSEPPKFRKSYDPFQSILCEIILIHQLLNLICVLYFS